MAKTRKLRIRGKITRSLRRQRGGAQTTAGKPKPTVEGVNLDDTSRMFRARTRAILADPTIMEITPAEYNWLPPIEKNKWKKIENRVLNNSYPLRREGYRGYDTIKYIRRIPEDDIRNLELSLEWKIYNNPNIRLSVSEYSRLTPEQKALGWIKEEVEVGMPGRGETEIQYRLRTLRDNHIDKYGPRGPLSDSDYHKLTPRQIAAGGWERKILIDRRGDETIHYVRTKPIPPLVPR